MQLTNNNPHYLLYTESRRIAREPQATGEWRFVLENLGTETRLEASDREVDWFGERLALLSVIRGLEAVERPARVTLITSSRYVSRGFRYGLKEWRENNWRWERFGEMISIKHEDLWRRIDRALHFHAVDCRTIPFDVAEQPISGRNTRRLWMSIRAWWQRHFAGSTAVPAAGL